MILLALDTSTDACSVALRVDDQLFIDHRVAAQQHGALVLPMIDALMSQAGLQASQLDALIYGHGPGSFTGVRIGVACAQGIALGADTGVVGVSTLQSIAQGVKREYGDTAVAVSVDARMDEVYFCQYALDENGLMQASGVEQIGAPEHIMQCQSNSWAGSGAERYERFLVDEKHVCAENIRRGSLPQAVDLLTLGAWYVQQGKLQAAELASPVYLRNKVALTTAERSALKLG